jgi:hypothetical protein
MGATPNLCSVDPAEHPLYDDQQFLKKKVQKTEKGIKDRSC